MINYYFKLFSYLKKPNPSNNDWDQWKVNLTKIEETKKLKNEEKICFINYKLNYGTRSSSLIGIPNINKIDNNIVFQSTNSFPLKNNYPPFNEFSIINPIIISGVIKHFCKKGNINLKFPNDVFINGKKVCVILQELIISNSRKFLIIGIGVNIVSNPKIKSKYQATNILLET